MPDQDVLVSPPRTVMEVFKTLPEGTHAEVIQSTLYIAPSPSPDHQDVAGNLFFEIKLFLKEINLGKVIISPIDVYLDEHSNAVQPDLVYISNENNLKPDARGLHGIPDLIIEVLSPGNKKHDQVTKKNLYEKFGVREYWIVDPQTRLASGYLLQNGVYVPLGEYTGKLPSNLLRKEFAF
jgi:Uma2 family endonuclease